MQKAPCPSPNEAHFSHKRDSTTFSNSLRALVRSSSALCSVSSKQPRPRCSFSTNFPRDSAPGAAFSSRFSDHSGRGGRSAPRSLGVWSCSSPELHNCVSASPAGRRLSLSAFQPCSGTRKGRNDLSKFSGPRYTGVQTRKRNSETVHFDEWGLFHSVPFYFTAVFPPLASFSLISSSN